MIKDYVVAVNGFAGPNYTKGFITFKFDEGYVPFVVGMNGTSPYHVTNKDLDELRNQFPSYLPTFEESQYRTRQEWGENEIEVGLSKLMQEKKLILKRGLNGEMVNIHFKWSGEVWSQEKRLTKRKLRKIVPLYED